MVYDVLHPGLAFRPAGEIPRLLEKGASVPQTIADPSEGRFSRR